RTKYDDLKQKLIDSVKEAKRLQKDLDKSQTKISQLESDVSVLDEKVARAERKTGNFNNLCGSYIQEASDLKNELEREKQQNIILTKRLEDLQAQITNQDNVEEIIHSDLDLDGSEFELTDLDSDDESEEDD